MGLEQLAAYLLNQQKNGWQISEPKKLAGYFELGVEDVTAALNTLVDSEVITTDPQDKLVVNPRLSDLTAEGILGILLPEEKPAEVLPPNPIQVIPLLTNLQHGDLFLATPPTDPAVIEQGKPLVDTFFSTRHDDWLRDEDLRQQ